MIRMGSILCLLVAAVLTGCRSSAELKCALPAPVGTPDGFVAVFDDGGRVAVYGQAELAGMRFPPCSTFKIVSSLMGLDAGVLENTQTRLGYDGSKYEYEAWNRDVTLLEAFQSSCVPYYKKLTGRLDRQYVQKTLDRLKYGNCDISVWNRNGHNVFWIESSLLISPVEQIAVQKKIFSGSSQFSPEHVAMLKKCMAAGTVGQFNLFGKTGTGRNHNTNHLEAWYVGFAESADGKRIYFAAHGADPARNVSSAEVRDIVKKILETTGMNAVQGNDSPARSGTRAGQ